MGLGRLRPGRDDLNLPLVVHVVLSAEVGGCWGPERPSPVTSVSSAPCMRGGCHAKTAWMSAAMEWKVVATWYPRHVCTFLWPKCVVDHSQTVSTEKKHLETHTHTHTASHPVAEAAHYVPKVVAVVVANYNDQKIWHSSPVAIHVRS